MRGRVFKALFCLESVLHVMIRTRRIATSSPRCVGYRKGPNAERIFPYIGGAEVNSEPKHLHHRYVINFGEMSEEEARQWPDLMTIVKERVKPERLAQKDVGAKENWWQFIRPRPELHAATAGLERLLVRSKVSGHHALAFVSTRSVIDQALIAFPFESFTALASIQSRAHEVWARFLGSSMKDDLQYTPTSLFETFPFPENWQNDPSLEAAGKTSYEFRADLMVRNDEGLTKTYNRFHDPEETHPDIVKLRELHAAMDRAVLNAYGWNDISTDCEFIADYEVEEGKKIPYRYRWPEEVHDEVLARLLELNQKRYEEEVAQGLHDKKKPKAKEEKSSKGQTELF